MIILEDIKLVLFDFDDTLCIHQIRKKEIAIISI